MFLQTFVLLRTNDMGNQMSFIRNSFGQVSLVGFQQKLVHVKISLINCKFSMVSQILTCMPCRWKFPTWNKRILKISLKSLSMKSISRSFDNKMSHDITEFSIVMDSNNKQQLDIRCYIDLHNQRYLTSNLNRKILQD